MADGQRFGFIAVLGAPNTGKSTLINRFVGAKVTIVSPKVQTTRTRVLGIAIAGQAQIVFVDTPGIFTPKRRLDRAMLSAAWQGVADADRVVVMVDATRGMTNDTRHVLETLEAEGRKAVAAINKVDAVRKEELLLIASALDASPAISEIFMISALNGDGVDDLLAALIAHLPEGPWHFPEDQLSDMPQRLLAAEITREKLFLKTHQEVPYALAVETESWEERKDGSVRIDQTVYVRRESQRAIVLGKGGQRVKAIGAAARQEMEEMFGRRVHLFLFVKVRDQWEEDPSHYSIWGLDYNV